MKIVPVWAAIETILSEDELTKDAIKSYTYPILRAGRKTPVCHIGRFVKAPLKKQYIKDAAGAIPYLLRGTTSVAILGRAYPGQHSEETADLDDIQHNIATVLNKHANHTLSGTVANCLVTGMYDVHENIETGNYFGFELILEYDKLE